MNHQEDVIGPAEFIMGEIAYLVSLRMVRGGISAAWECPACSMTQAVDQSMPTADKAISFAKHEIAEHHKQHHEEPLAPHAKPPRENC